MINIKKSFRNYITVVIWQKSSWIYLQDKQKCVRLIARDHTLTHYICKYIMDLSKDVL